MSTSDREWLELAAKAVGITFDKSSHNGGGHANNGFDACGNAVLDWHNGTTWNPLTDDGDALRLAVKLKINLEFAKDGVDAGYGVEATNDYPTYRLGCITERYKGDHYAATRRAIVRAAAEIGKGMRPFPTAEEIERFANMHDKPEWMK